MSDSTGNKMDREGVFKFWLSVIRSDKALRYKYGERKKHIQNLISGLLDNDISQDDAEFLKRRVVEALVTKEGMSDKGEYKGWKKNAEEDFDDAIQQGYVGAKIRKKKELESSFDEDPIVVRWCKDTFGNDVDLFTIKEAHTPFTVLRSNFLKSMVKSAGGRK